MANRVLRLKLKHDDAAKFSFIHSKTFYRFLVNVVSVFFFFYYAGLWNVGNCELDGSHLLCSLYTQSGVG